MTDRNRRRLMQAGASLPLAGWSATWAQTPERNLLATERKPAAAAPTGASLLIAPRHALVIGNSSYGFGPLKNPANDAKALGAELKSAGFEVTVGLDLTRKDMLEAIRAYGESLNKTKAIGVFYFAGHGLQLAWRNYLVPTDATIAKMDDIQAKCVDVNAVIEGIAKAVNPMNVVILDACRENPFGGDVKLEAAEADRVRKEKEAERLWQERIEKAQREEADRLRKEAEAARARQEAEEKKRHEQLARIYKEEQERRRKQEESDRAYEEELRLWTRVSDSKETGPIEDYLRRYPSGRFCEIAQVQLDRILAAQGEKKVEAVSAAENPYSQGSATLTAGWKVGYAYTYDVMDLYSKVVSRTASLRITAVTDTQVIYNSGTLITDLLGNSVLLPDGRRFTPSQFLPTEYRVGKRWRTRYNVSNPRFGDFRTTFDLRIAARERVTVP